MSTLSYTCKLPIVESNSLCVLNTEWKEDSFNLVLLHDNQAYQGKFQVTNNEDVVELLDQLALTAEEYVKQTTAALTTHGGAELFAYSIQHDRRLFTWKKLVGKNMAIKFGFVHLEKVEVFEVFEEIIDKVLQTNVDLSEQLKNSTKLIESLSIENQNLRIKTNDLTNKKEEMEATLYSQFLYLLNEKKKRICELQKNLDPCVDNESPSGLNQSDSDPFNSDTEIDSDEDEKSTQKLGNGDNWDTEVIRNYIPVPSKRSRKTGNLVNDAAGHSGTNLKTSKPKACPSSSNVKQKTKPQGKCHPKFSCVFGDLAKEKEKSNSEEDAFTFPKRSRRTNGVKLVKPSTSRVQYESDDEVVDDTTSENIPKLKTGNENMSSEEGQIEVNNKISTVEVSSATSKSRASSESVCCSELNSTDTNANKLIESIANVESFSGFSTSTLDILNKLI